MLRIWQVTLFTENVQRSLIELKLGIPKTVLFLFYNSESVDGDSGSWQQATAIGK